MYVLEFRTKAYANIQSLHTSHPDDMSSIDQGFSDLEKNGLGGSQIKRIGRIAGGMVYRKRVGRWRMVFMMKKNVVDIFLIEIEKDTTKDYRIWLDYVIQSLKE